MKVVTRYQQKIFSKDSIRDRMQFARNYGVTPGCIPDPKKNLSKFSRFKRWCKLPRKAIHLYWRVRGVKTWQDMRNKSIN